MSGCVAKRWGTTSFSKNVPTNPEAHQEMEKRLAALQEARNQQDRVFTAEPAKPSSVTIPAYDVKKTRGF